MKRIIGLTGLTGAGKSTVAAVFASLGATVVDCDVIAREALADKTVKRALASSFGDGIFLANGDVDRKALASLAFASSEATKRLNEATHPYILAETRRRANEAKTTAVIDAPLLFQSGLSRDCDVTVAVTADRETRLARIRARDGITRKAAEERMKAQKDLAKQMKQADIELSNGAGVSEEALTQAAALLYRSLT